MTSSRDVLLVDTNRGAQPLLTSLQAQGWTPWVMGSDPEAPLAKLCPNYVRGNYADPEVLAAVVMSRPFAAVIPGCTDASYLACAALQRGPGPGLDGPEAVRQLFDKQALRAVARQLGIHQPRELSAAEAVGLEQVLVKPVDGFSGAGMTRLMRPDAEQLRAAVAAAAARSPAGRALIEEFVAGQLYSHSAFLRERRIVQDFFVREDCSDYPYAVDTSCLDADLADSVRGQVRRDVEHLAQRLQLGDGLIHSQFIVRGNQPHLLEITRRHPGDLYGRLIALSTGFDYASHYLEAFLPEPCRLRASGEGAPWIIRHTITAGAGQDLWGLRFHQPVMIREWIPLAVAGSTLPAAPQGRAAIVFLESESEAQHQQLYARLVERTLYSFVC